MYCWRSSFADVSEASVETSKASVRPNNDLYRFGSATAESA